MTVEESLARAVKVARDLRYQNVTIADLMELAADLRREEEGIRERTSAQRRLDECEARLFRLEGRAVLRPEGMPAEAVPTEWKIAGRGMVSDFGNGGWWAYGADGLRIAQCATLPEALAALGVSGG